ncbi:MAG TPA: hypothetical protein VLA96_05505 [Terriglobales bacterium]|nr:hypothetical protein [Terriglobales bacterium]
MKRFVGGFLLGAIAGGLAVWGYLSRPHRALATPAVCYSCFWQTQSAALRKDLIDFYQQYRSPDEFVMGDVAYILWRAKDQPNCDARERYRAIASDDSDGYRKFLARGILAFSGSECGAGRPQDFGAAAEQARMIGLAGEAKLLDALAQNKPAPEFGDVELQGSVPAPRGAKTLILGESRIEVAPDTRLGAQVDRVSRDWLSYQLKWDMSGAALPPQQIIGWHEGRFIRYIVNAAPVEVHPLSGTLVAKKGEKWYAPDENGVFRFEVLLDKVEYPTTHVAGQFGLLEDTHGISALVSQAMRRGMQVVVGCGDSDGKVKAAYYLAQRGVHVIMPGDRYDDELVGYQGKGVILGTAPVRAQGNKAVIGGQPVRFALAETIVVEDTKAIFPIQYYDAGARYFRRLAKAAPLKLEFVNVDDQNQIARVLDRADELRATAVAVRVMTKEENDRLVAWLSVAPQRRAILFHSGLYEFAQPLFEKFPQQVTFGDLRPRFE